MNSEEQILYEQLKAGNESAYGILYRNHYAILCHFANFYLHDRFSAESVVEDVIYHLWENRESLNITKSIRSYLVMAVRNKWIPEVGYTTPEPDRWQKAAKAATEALDAAQTAGYELYNLNGDLFKNYQLIFMDNTAANKETLFARMGTSSADGESISSCDQ